MGSESDPRLLEILLSNHRRFLAFLERRTGSRGEAEDLLQAAFVRALEQGDDLRADESAVAWFFRLLRNALVDRDRKRAAGERALVEKSEEVRLEDPDALRAEVCRCVGDLLPTLQPDYALLLRRVDLQGEPVKRVAESLGITPNHAGVRLHRARRALLKEVQRSCRTCATHGCLDCCCR